MKKLLSIFWFALFIWIFWYLYWEEYIAFQQEAQVVRQQQNQITQEVQDFSVGDIRDLESVEFYHTPDTSFLNDMVARIDNADKRVYLEVYIFTEKRIRSALKAAHKRGVDVRIILEKNPYLAPRLNDSVFNELKDFGINIVYWWRCDYFYRKYELFYICI